MRLALLVVLASTAAGCGVGTYRAARVTGEMQMRFVANEGGDELARWFSEERLTLEHAVVVDAANVREVHLEERPDGGRHIVLYLDEVGAERLAEATRDNEGRRLAIVVEGRIVAAPTIRTPITEGVAHVTVEGDVEQVFDALTRPRE